MNATFGSRTTLRPSLNSATIPPHFTGAFAVNDLPQSVATNPIINSKESRGLALTVTFRAGNFYDV